MMRMNNRQWHPKTNKYGRNAIQVWNSRSVTSGESYGFDEGRSFLSKTYDDKTWQPQLPADINVFKSVDLELNTIKNKDIKEAMVDFIFHFKKMLYSITRQKNMAPLPLIYLTENEEDSAYLEWIFDDSRFVFSFNPNQEDSYWLLVANKNSKKYSISGDLSDDKIKSEISQIIHLALENG